MASHSAREVLQKDPKERTTEDIDILFDFIQGFQVILFFVYEISMLI
jgi:hypothetical protein